MGLEFQLWKIALMDRETHVIGQIEKVALGNGNSAEDKPR